MRRDLVLLALLKNTLKSIATCTLKPSDARLKHEVACAQLPECLLPLLLQHDYQHTVATGFIWDSFGDRIVEAYSNVLTK